MGVADAIRYELSTGNFVGGKSHLQKGYERITNLQRILDNQILNSSERSITLSLLKDLQDTINGN